MDNASKALIFAGGILIAVLVISVSIYVITSARGVAKASNERLEANAVQSFNRFYLAYEGKDISWVDALNIYRKATDDNDSSHPIESITGAPEIETASNKWDIKEEEWANGLSDNPTYKVEYTTDADGYIYKIEFVKN